MTTVSDAELDELESRMDEAAKADITGGVRRYIELFDHADDYTLMAPYGGDTHHGFSPTEEDIEATSKFFVSGQAMLEVEQRYASGNLVVLVVVERQRGQVGDYAEQDWSSRDTFVFRRVDVSQKIGGQAKVTFVPRDGPLAGPSRMAVLPACNSAGRPPQTFGSSDVSG